MASLPGTSASTSPDTRLQLGKGVVSSRLESLHDRWRVRSLEVKLLLPSSALVLLFLIGSTIVFIHTSRLTSRRLLEQQISAEADLVTDALTQRAEVVSSAGSLLARDRAVVQAIQEETDAAPDLLNGRALAMRDRFDLALVQICDQRGLAKANLLLPTLCTGTERRSSMLNMAEPDTLVVRVVEDRLLLLTQTPIEEGTGTVVVGVDLETELDRILTDHHLLSELSLSLRGAKVSTDSGLGFDALGDSPGNHHVHKRSIALGATSTELLLVRPIQDIKQMAHMGLLATLGSAFLITLLLGSLNVMTVRLVVQPIRALATAANAMALGSLEQRVCLPPNPLAVGNGDEIGLLADSFNEIAINLRDLYLDLETKVEGRTASLSIEAELARAASSSLDLDVILQESSQIIKERLGSICPGVYHVGVFLVERTGDVLVLRQAASEGVRELRAEDLRIPLGCRTPMSTAASTGCPHVVQNVKTESAHLKPPLLMDTYSAAAIPLRIDDAIIGILDVQSKQSGVFTDDMIHLLNALADRIAVGARNALQYDQKRKAAERKAEEH